MNIQSHKGLCALNSEENASFYIVFSRKWGNVFQLILRLAQVWLIPKGQTREGEFAQTFIPTIHSGRNNERVFSSNRVFSSKAIADTIADTIAFTISYIKAVTLSKRE